MQNGGYIQPAPVKRQFRDPHADWWDKQERKNFGESLHEDDDTLGMFSTYEYTWISPGKGLVQIGIFIATFLSVVYAVKATYPDRVSYPREFEGGLDRELGGRNATVVRSSHSDLLLLRFASVTFLLLTKMNRQEHLAIRSRSRMRWTWIEEGSCTLRWQPTVRKREGQFIAENAGAKAILADIYVLTAAIFGHTDKCDPARVAMVAVLRAKRCCVPVNCY